MEFLESFQPYKVAPNYFKNIKRLFIYFVQFTKLFGIQCLCNLPPNPLKIIVNVIQVRIYIWVAENNHGNLSLNAVKLIALRSASKKVSLWEWTMNCDKSTCKFLIHSHYFRLIYLRSVLQYKNHSLDHSNMLENRACIW